jgi:CRP-like cAMP-binding protein
MQADSATFKNGILAALPPDDLDLLRPRLEPVDLPLRIRLAAANQTIEHVYFPEAGIASIVTGLRHESPIEVGIIGREGFVNLAVVMGSDQSPNDVFVQSAGHGHRMDASRLRDAIAASPTLLRVLLHYAHVFMTQTASTVLANGQAKVSERLARWLLMAHDRVDGDVLHSTHEFLSIMLGVRRSSVTNALRDFEARGVVARMRGELKILDRDGLVTIANGYYGAAEREMLRLYGSPGRPC